MENSVVKPRFTEGAFGTHAIVVGASMAGMLAARVLSEKFTRVTVLEREMIPGGLIGRPGVPQARHLHALLPKGRSHPGKRKPRRGPAGTRTRRRQETLPLSVRPYTPGDC